MQPLARSPPTRRSRYGVGVCVGLHMAMAKHNVNLYAHLYLSLTLSGVLLSFLSINITTGEEGPSRGLFSNRKNSLGQSMKFSVHTAFDAHNISFYLLSFMFCQAYPSMFFHVSGRVAKRGRALHAKYLTSARTLERHINRLIPMHLHLTPIS